MFEMTVSEHAYAQALVLAGPLEPEQSEKLKILCDVVQANLRQRIRPDLDPNDFRADFIAAVGLLGVAALGELEADREPAYFSAGDLTVRKTDASVSANYLRGQAQMLLAPYLKDGFCFRGV